MKANAARLPSLYCQYDSPLPGYGAQMAILTANIASVQADLSAVELRILQEGCT
jgi:hypothetical protein